MQKVKKICCRITPRRSIGAVLVATNVVNLIIVGTVFEISSPAAAAPTTAIQMIPDATTTFFVPTATVGEVTPVTLVPSAEPTQTATSTSTETPTSSVTATDLPSSTPCVQRYDWPVYFVRRGDTLFSLALAIGSSVEELMLANCLHDTRIYAGQQIYVPRLPESIFTAPPSLTPTNTPSTTTPMFTPTPTPTETPFLL